MSLINFAEQNRSIGKIVDLVSIDVDWGRCYAADDLVLQHKASFVGDKKYIIHLDNELMQLASKANIFNRLGNTIDEKNTISRFNDDTDGSFNYFRRRIAASQNIWLEYDTAKIIKQATAKNESKKVLAVWIKLDTDKELIDAEELAKQGLASFAFQKNEVCIHLPIK